MVLSSEQIRTEKDHSYNGTEIWNENELAKKIVISRNKLNQLSKIFGEKEFYVHPVKLSKFS